MKQTIQKECQKQIISDEKVVQPSTLTNPMEKGRSMLEILGVLAVIGVLSVGGIMGYKYGMLKYRVNETINELNIMANTYGVQMQQMAEDQIMPAEGELLSEENAITRMGYGYEVLGFDNHFEIALFDVPNPECEQLQKTGWELPYEIKAETVTAESCGELVYYIDNGLTGTLTEYIDSDEEDDEEQDKNCGLYGHWNGEKCVCDTGYMGTNCKKCDASLGYNKQDSRGKCYKAKDSSECTAETYCNSAGTDWFDYQCNCYQCKRGYYGKNCENYDETGDACNGQGIWLNSLIDGSGCSCNHDYYGLHCEYTDPDEECNGRGSRYGYGACFCLQGFYGENCEYEGEQEDTIPCKSGNVLTNENGEKYCECGSSSYGGPDCSWEDYCYQQTGSWYSHWDSLKQKCVCTGGYGGENCKTQICKNYSSRYDEDSKTCICPAGYTGDFCETPICSGAASFINGECVCTGADIDGTCSNYISSQCNNKGYYTNGKCYCRAGYSGSDCKKHACNEHGYYNNSDGSCSCYSGYSGSDCSEVVCNGHGSLNDDGTTCSCHYGYGGDNCKDVVCSGHGNLVNGKCVCEDNYYTGANCETRVCSGHGYIDSTGRCSCYSNYVSTGTDCVLSTASGDCNNRGTKVNGVCQCNQFYTGTNCETPVCNGRGYISDTGKCICSQGTAYSGGGSSVDYGGDNCEVVCENDCGDGYNYYNPKTKTCTCVYKGF